MSKPLPTAEIARIVIELLRGYVIPASMSSPAASTSAWPTNPNKEPRA